MFTKGRKMNFEEKKQLALAELKSKKFWKVNYQPPIYILLWKLGFKIRPPHYQKLITNFLISSIFFGVGVGLINWILFHDMSFPLTIETVNYAVFSGIIFGLIISLYYFLEAKRRKLTKWDNFG
jgi:hypothetical protein